jgi:acetyltransferase-like isoleucine patch superfamily enzyme
MQKEREVEEFQALRNHIRKSQQAQYAGGYICVGDFSYGIPCIRSWNEGASLVIGKFCSIASGVTIMLGGEHRVDWNSTYPFNVLMSVSFGHIKGHPHSKGDVIIGNDVWIGSEVKIMSGVRIADGCVIGANAVVTKSIDQPYAIAGGVPAKIIRSRFSGDHVRKLCEMQWWDWEDQDIVSVIPLLQSNDINALWMYYKEHKCEGK